MRFVHHSLQTLNLSLSPASALNQFAGLHSKEKNESVLTSIIVCLRETLCHIYARGFQVATSFLPHIEQCPDRGTMLNKKINGERQNRIMQLELWKVKAYFILFLVNLENLIRFVDA